MGHLETEGTFWRSTYLFSCSYLEWLCHDRLSWCVSWTYFPSLCRISSSSTAALRRQGQRSLWVPVAGSQDNWLRRKCVHLHLVITPGPSRCPLYWLVLCSCSADSQTASLVDYIQVWVCVTGVGRIFSRQLACCAWSLIVEMVSCPQFRIPFYPFSPLFRFTNCVLCSPY